MSTVGQMFIVCIFSQDLPEELKSISAEHKREATAIHNLVRTHFGQSISCKSTIDNIRRFVFVCKRKPVWPSFTFKPLHKDHDQYNLVLFTQFAYFVFDNTVLCDAMRLMTLQTPRRQQFFSHQWLTRYTLQLSKWICWSDRLDQQQLAVHLVSS
jgi:hypothetical protein